MVRLFCWVLGILTLGWFAWPYVYPDGTMSTESESPDSSHSMNFTQDGDEYELVGGDELPEEPVPIVVTDSQGQSRWTVSIPPKLEFPLAPSEYSSICRQSSEVAEHVTDQTEEHSMFRIRRKRHSGHKAHHSYYYEDPNYMDVADAEAEGLLPSVKDGDDSGDGREVCEKSLTFVMQTEDPGLGRSLLRLWMSYGLAQKEGRAFFVEDTNWAYGKYSTYFQPPPTQDCRPPPRNQRVPCPRHANHLIISSATTTWAFGHGFTDQFEDPKKMGVERQEPIFALLRSGYEALFKLADQDAAYYNKRVNALNSTIRAEGGIQIGAHVRHGDVHPREFQYQRSYIPLEKYVEAGKDLIAAAFGKKDEKNHRESNEEAKSKIIFASDDPDVYSAEELNGSEKAQYQISLASKSALDASKGPRPQNVGWEGGFFKDIFWSLGAPSFDRGSGTGSPNPSKMVKRQMPDQSAHSVNLAAAWKDAEKDFHYHPTPEALRLRELVGRGYVLDLAVLAQTDRVVCGISSSACRILAVMMGWEEGIIEGGWNNIDGSWHWKGIFW